MESKLTEKQIKELIPKGSELNPIVDKPISKTDDLIKTKIVECQQVS